jgi:hypothetical protein
MNRSVRVVCLALLSAMLLGVGPASAAVKTVKTTVKITSGEGSEFKGKVSSSMRQCRAGRTVKLYMEVESARATGDTLVGTAKTDASGVWDLEGSFIAGVYYARVASLLFHAHGQAFRCSYTWTMPMHY